MTMAQSICQFETIYLAADHAGFDHKEAVKAWLQSERKEVCDCGALHFNSEDDFPFYMQMAGKAVAKSGGTGCAIIFGGSGQGEAMAANRIKGVRAVVYYGGPDAIIDLSREHNHANVLSIGARFVSVDDAKRVIWDWLHHRPLPDEKYARRNRQLDA